MKKLLLILVSCSLFAGFSQAASVQSRGLIALYQTSPSGQTHQILITQLEKKLKASACVVHREGKILSKQGNYSFSAQNHFFMLECASPQLAQNSSWLNLLDQQVSNLVVQEGPIAIPDRPSLVESGQSREFIIKFSDYNNASPIKRDSDLFSLEELVNTRGSKYTSEATIRVYDAYGMSRADEVVMIYYDSPEDANKFRSSNDDIMPKIAAFNRDHLTRFAYLTAQSNR